MKTFTVIGIIVLSFYSSIEGQVPDSLKFKSLGPEAFHLSYLKENKAILIDVREFFEFRKARLKDAINMPSSGNPENAADTLHKDSALFLYCTSGYRSKKVAIKFYGKGFLRLYNLDGGIIAWKKAGLPVEKKRLRGSS